MGTFEELAVFRVLGPLAPARRLAALRRRVHLGCGSGSGRFLGSGLVHGGELSKGRALAFLFLLFAFLPFPATAAQRFPNVVILTVDTLRADHLSSYGYHRPTTPNIDRLLASGVRFTDARTVEPLTNPALCSLFTSLYPHEHGATRNGLRMRPGLPSLARALRARGYESAAFVSNWPLKERISGLGQHFDRYEEVFTRKRWLGLFKDEANAGDLTDGALAWLARPRSRPFLLWVHYVEPHAPYRLHSEMIRPLGLDPHGETSRIDRYDTEIAFADLQLGRLLVAFDRDPELRANTLFVFAGDHGESLGEHGYWGHGRNLYEPTLRIPLGLAWTGKIHPGTTIDAPAQILDVAPTLLGLAGLPVPAGFQGFDWTPVLLGTPPPRGRVLWFEAHKGAVLSSQEAANARRKGLLAVGMIVDGRKQILAGNTQSLFELAADPAEAHGLSADSRLAQRLYDWMGRVQKGLAASDRVGPATVAAEDTEIHRTARTHHMPNDKTHNESYEEGLRIRREVLGEAHVDKSLAQVSEFSKPIQELVTEYCWGIVWSRDGLSRKTRSLLNLGMLTALNRSHELGVHVRGALKNGRSGWRSRRCFCRPRFTWVFRLLSSRSASPKRS